MDVHGRFYIQYFYGKGISVSEHSCYGKEGKFGMPISAEYSLIHIASEIII
jgi:hypothetical protein